MTKQSKSFNQEADTSPIYDTALLTVFPTVSSNSPSRSKNTYFGEWVSSALGERANHSNQQPSLLMESLVALNQQHMKVNKN